MGNWLGEETEMKPFMPGAWRVTRGRLFCGVLTACMNLCTDPSWLCAAFLPPLWHVERMMTSVSEHQAVPRAEGRICLAFSGPRLSGADSLVGSPWCCVKHPAEVEEGLLTPLRFWAAPPGSSCPLTNLAVAWLSCFVDNLSHHSWLSFSLSLASGCQWWLVWWMNVAPHYIHPWPFWRFLLSTSFFPAKRLPPPKMQHSCLSGRGRWIWTAAGPPAHHKWCFWSRTWDLPSLQIFALGLLGAETSAMLLIPPSALRSLDLVLEPFTGLSCLNGCYKGWKCRCHC